MKAWGTICLISVGGLTDTLTHIDKHNWQIWAVLLAVSVIGWGWSAAIAGAGQLIARTQHVITGRPIPRATTDPKALAAEIAALNAQVSQLRDTATSFDVSFDHTLQRLDERLRRIEQQSAYVTVRNARE